MLRLFAGLFSRLFGVKKDFILLFMIREGKELMGRHYKNFWILIGIIFLTFIAIGFSTGSLKYLEFKMNDPFMKFITILVPNDSVSERISTIRDTLMKDSYKEKFMYKNVTGHDNYWVYFRNPIKNQTYVRKGRPVPYDASLINAIFDPKNFPRGHKFSGKNDLGIIVKQSFLESLQYDPDTSHVFMYYSSGEKSWYIPIPIIAVVKELPDLCDFVTTPYFYYLRYKGEGEEHMSPKYTRQLRIWVNGDSLKAARFFEQLQQFTKTEKAFQGFTPAWFSPQKDINTNKGYIITAAFDPRPDSVEIIDNMYAAIQQAPEFKSYGILHLYFPREVNKYSLEKPGILSVEFDKTDMIREFRNYLYKTYSLNIDMASVEAMENYNFITKLTRLISFILLIFSVMSISFFLSNVLRNHLESIKMNIGTFKAFGLETKLLKRIYLLISGGFVLLCIIISLLFSWFFEMARIANYGLLLLFKNMEKNQTYFTLMNPWTIIAILVILLCSIIVMNKTMNNIFTQNPGDLIYDRDKE
ncbi:MAG: ABC transporter permease [Bacteroidetes bacterium]|nr:ABC transporter permease [Bacteroidota bacterium]